MKKQLNPLIFSCVLISIGFLPSVAFSLICSAALSGKPITQTEYSETLADGTNVKHYLTPLISIDQVKLFAQKPTLNEARTLLPQFFHPFLLKLMSIDLDSASGPVELSYQGDVLSVNLTEASGNKEISFYTKNYFNQSVVFNKVEFTQPTRNTFILDIQVQYGSSLEKLSQVLTLSNDLPPVFQRIKIVFTMSYAKLKPRELYMGNSNLGIPTKLLRVYLPDEIISHYNPSDLTDVIDGPRTGTVRFN